MPIWLPATSNCSAYGACSQCAVTPYTPRPIADLLVRASFRALDCDGSSAKARILDPAAAAGVFLLTALIRSSR